MKIGTGGFALICLQLEPVLGEVQRNIDHATNMVEELMPEQVDVLVLPEMAFTGYVFTSKDHIRPYLEDAESGPSVQWAKLQAVRLNAHVQVGYPEKRVVRKDGQSHEDYYNSVCFVSPEGRLLTTYAKHFLFYTDENWAEEGPEFKCMSVEGLGQVGFGICMDVNPYRFKTAFTDFEFSSFHFSRKTNLMLCSMAWNKGEEAPKKERKVAPKPSKSEGEEEGVNEDEDEEWEDEEDEEEQALELQYDTIQYWAVRMSPFYGKGQKPAHEAFIAIANRIGTEAGNLFVGSSCVMRLTASGPELVDSLPSNKEGLLRVEI